MKKIIVPILSVLILVFMSCETSKQVTEIKNEKNPEAPEIQESTEAPLFTTENLTQLIEPDVTTIIPENTESSSSEKEVVLEKISDEEPAPFELVDLDNELEDLTFVDDNLEVLNPEVVLPDSIIQENSDDNNLPTESLTDSFNDSTVDFIDPESNDEIEFIEENNTEDENQTEEESISIENIVPSRSVTLKRKEYVEITYPGNGWVYMGAVDGSKNLVYFGRALGTKDTSFSLQARTSGRKILHFYKNDHLTGEYIDDFIEIIILDEEGSNKTHVDAPPYKQPLSEKSKELLEKKDNQNNIIREEVEQKPQEQVSIPESENKLKPQEAPGQKSPETKKIKDSEKKEENHQSEKNNIIQDVNTLLKEAQLLYNEKEFKLADEKINQFLKAATKNIDEGLFLKGQILEAKSEIQNIKNAIKAYSALTEEFPASKYWDQANRRIIYLKRFYLEVR